MNDGEILVGVIGAGKDARINIIPALRAMDRVKVVGVVNSSRESSERVAREMDIPTVYDNWLELVRAPDTNAIVVGTFPDTHCPITLEALANDKHVLCESRMANNSREARAMLEASRRKPHLITQIVPAPFTFQVDKLVMGLINDGYLGKVLSADMWIGRSIDNPVPGGFADFDSPLDWRQDRNQHGYNALGLGIFCEVLMRWLGPFSRVMANGKTFVPQRRGPDGDFQVVTLPDHIDVLCDMACGAQARIGVSTVTGLAPLHQTWLFGTEGTLLVTGSPMDAYEIRDTWAPPPEETEGNSKTSPWREDVHYRDHTMLRVYGGKRGETQLSEIPNPEENRYRWRAGEEFVRAIRGLEKVTRTPFDVGVQYVEFVEAVIRSAQTGKAVSLPL